MNKYPTLLTLYRVLSRAYFYLPIFAIYLNKLGLDIFEICIFLAIYCGSSLITSEVIRNINLKLSCKKSLIISELIKSTGLALIIIGGDNFSYIALAQTLLGAGYVIGAGHDSKLIFKFVGNAQHFQSKSNAYMFYSLLFSGVLGYFLFMENAIYPFYFSLTSSLVLVLILFIFLPNDKITENTPPPNLNQGASQERVENILNYSFIRGIVLTIFTGFLPLYLYIDLGVKSYEFIALISSYTIVGFISSKYMSQLFIDRWWILDISLISSLLILMSGEKEYMIFSTLLFGLVSGISRPVCMNKIKSLGLDVVKESGYLERYYALINVSFLLLGGYYYEHYKFDVVVYISLAIYTVYLIIKFSNRRTQPELSQRNNTGL